MKGLSEMKIVCGRWSDLQRCQKADRPKIPKLPPQSLQVPKVDIKTIHFVPLFVVHIDIIKNIFQKPIDIFIILVYN